ncbi:MAG: DUF4912 domain-containing protein [Syntrophomonas sp.]
MIPVVFIITVSLILIAMLYWVLHSSEGQRRPGPNNEYQFESAQELFKYAPDEAYLDEDKLELVRRDDDRVRALWNLSEDKWQQFSKNAENDKNREPFLRIYLAGELLHTMDVPLKQKNGHFDYDLAPFTASYFTLGYKDNKSFCPLLTSRTIMRQC